MNFSKELYNLMDKPYKDQIKKDQDFWFVEASFYKLNDQLKLIENFYSCFEKNSNEIHLYVENFFYEEVEKKLNYKDEDIIDTLIGFFMFIRPNL
jgi:hypothetical protein